MYAAVADWTSGLDLKKLPGAKADVLLFAGCQANYNPKASLAARQMAKLLLQAGVKFGVLAEEEKCCGLPAHWTGFRADFEKLAGENAAVFQKTGVKAIVTTCGACLGTLKAKYPQYGVKTGVKVLHATELLEQLIRKKKLKLGKPLDLRVTYHDPCYLGRQSEPPTEWHGEQKTVFGQMKYTVPPRKINYGTGGVFDPPRAILKSIKGLSFREMYRIREYSHCCGGGGGNAAQYHAMSLHAASERLEEAHHVGADYLVTSCAHCKDRFEKASLEQGLNGMHIVDIIDLVFRAAGIE
jgi:Fe-S oxidoreductase